MLSNFDFSTAIGFSALFTIIIYVSVILSTFKLTYLKKMKLVLWEYILLIISFVSLTWMTGFYFENLFSEIVNKQETVINIVQIICLVGLFAFSIIWYYAYYNPKYKARLIKHPDIQKELDKVFIPKPYNKDDN